MSNRITPYLSGETRVSPEGPVLILGHVWWPVEKQNAYYCILLKKDGSFRSGEPIYIWHSDATDWSVFEPEAKNGVQ